MLTQDDIDYMRRTADEYDTLLERWKHARAGSQEVANLHATFKARGGEVGRMVENGLFRRVLASLDAAVLAAVIVQCAGCGEGIAEGMSCRRKRGHVRPPDCKASPPGEGDPDAYGVKGPDHG